MRIFQPRIVILKTMRTDTFANMELLVGVLGVARDDEWRNPITYYP
jgi:hypothetical protein